MNKHKIIRKMEITGILVKKTSERSGVSQRNGQPWHNAEYLVEVHGQYPRHINFRVSDGQVGRLARFDSLIGKTVTVSFDIDAHEHEGRWFNEINAWGIMEYIDQATRQANIAAAAKPQPTEQPATGENKDDDLPF